MGLRFANVWDQWLQQHRVSKLDGGVCLGKKACKSWYLLFVSEALPGCRFGGGMLEEDSAK